MNGFGGMLFVQLSLTPPIAVVASHVSIGDHCNPFFSGIYAHCRQPNFNFEWNILPRI